jgi:hypothetical protein
VEDSERWVGPYQGGAEHVELGQAPDKPAAPSCL